MVNIYPNRKLMNYGYKEQMKDLLQCFVIAVIMGIVAYSITYLHLTAMVTIILQIMVGIIVYFGLSYLWKIDEFYTVLDYIQKSHKKEKKNNI